MTDGWCISCEIALMWMSMDLTDDKSTLVQVMAWCREATSLYLSPCWPRSMIPCDVTRPQWVKMVDWSIIKITTPNSIAQPHWMGIRQHPESQKVYGWMVEERCDWWCFKLSMLVGPLHHHLQGSGSCLTSNFKSVYLTQNIVEYK